MENLKPINKEELVDSIMAATLQCGLTVEKITIEDSRVVVTIENGIAIEFDLDDAWTWTLEELQDVIGKQIHGR